MTSAKGTFEVTTTSKTPLDSGEGAQLGRMSLSKQFHGDLDATSTVEMISARSDVRGSAGYVAIERVSGRLHGRTGNFVLQHSGTMNRGMSSLSVTVVPDTATGELKGLAGSMSIEITDGKHSFAFEYTLGDGT
jgi:hypothetical protein